MCSILSKFLSNLIYQRRSKTYTGVLFITVAERLNGFKLYVTNSSNIPPEGYLCYADPYPSPLPKIIQSIPCHNLGKYVIYYDTTGTTPYGPIIELCYVAINGRLIMNE